jgi:hypothetical protein
MAKENRTDQRVKRWLVCQTGIVAVRVIPQVGVGVRVIPQVGVVEVRVIPQVGVGVRVIPQVGVWVQSYQR